MKKPKEPLCEMHQHLYDIVENYVENGKYEVSLKDDPTSSVSGYIDGYVNIAGINIVTSFNNRGFCCFHVDYILKPVLELLTSDEQQRMVNLAYEQFRNNKNRYKTLIEDYKKRIADLENGIEEGV